MPTGYTCNILNDISFEEFIWDCARAFGALIHMRDENFDAKIKFRKPSSFTKKLLEDYQKEYETFCKMNSDEVEKIREDEFQENLKQYNERQERQRKNKRKYELMLKKVKEWIPPTSNHNALKEFMIKQIEETIDFDCTIDYKQPEKEPFGSWYKRRKHELEQNIEYYKQSHEKNIQSCNEANDWIKQLNASVPCPNMSEQLVEW